MAWYKPPIIGAMQGVASGAVGWAAGLNHPLLRGPAAPPVLRGDRGGPAIATASPSAVPPSIRAMQQFLRSKGYNIAVDGTMGPQTRSAAEDWRGNRNPKIWSSRIKMDDPNRTNKPTSAVNQRNQPADSPNNSLRPETKEKPGLRTPQAVKGIGKGVLSNNSVNPSVYARAMVDSKYGPILGELVREENKIREDGRNAVNQVGTWYNNIGLNMRERAEANKVSDSRVQAGIDSIAPGFAAALGLDENSAATGDLMADADVGSDFWRESSASQQAFDRSLMGVTALQGAETRAGIQKDTASALQEIMGVRRDALASKGNEYIGAEQDARVLNANLRSDQLKNSLAQQQMALAIRTSGLDEATQMAQLQGLLLGNDQTALENDAIRRGPAAAPKGWMNPDLNRDELLTNALSTIKLPSGQWRLGLNPSWARVKGYLGQQGLATNSTEGQKWLRDFAKIAGIRLGPKGNPIGRLKYNRPVK